VDSSQGINGIIPKDNIGNVVVTRPIVARGIQGFEVGAIVKAT